MVSVATGLSTKLRQTPPPLSLSCAIALLQVTFRTEVACLTHFLSSNLLSVKLPYWRDIVSPCIFSQAQSSLKTTTIKSGSHSARPLFFLFCCLASQVLVQTCEKLFLARIVSPSIFPIPCPPLLSLFFPCSINYIVEEGGLLWLWLLSVQLSVVIISHSQPDT